MAFTLYQNDEVKKLRELVAADAEIPLDQLLLVQLKGDGFGATYSDEQPLSDIPENEVVYAVEAHPENSDMHGSTQEFDSPIAQVLLIHVEVRGKSAHRFGCPAMLKVRRDITWRSLQMEILEKMEGSLSEDIFHQTQKLNGLFLLRIYDGSSRKYYLSSDVEMPLYSQSVERAYALSDKDSGPPHIKIIAEWGHQTKSRVVLDDQEHIEISTSVTKAQNHPAGQGKISLEECFRLYTQEEKLIGDDAWLCPHCKKQQQGTIKTLGLWSLPEILVLHLKRFKQTGLRRSKLNTLIDFPIDGLDMSCHLSRQSHGHPFKGNDYIYDLIGVSNHYGNMMGGHYMAYCRNPIDGKWREYNDARVRILEGPVATREAYILFYQRRSLSKNVNQRLSSGDHWIYSLPLAPAEGTREILTSGTSRNSNLELTHQARHSRSRSASPSTRRQNKGWNTHCIPIHLLTPQPVRRPMMSSISDEDISDNSMSTSSSAQNSSANHRSRPIQRPSFDSRSQFSHETSARDSSSVHVKNPSKAHFNRRSPSVDKKGFVADHSKMIKPKLSSSVTKSEPQTSSRTTDIDKPPPVMVPRHDLPMSSDFGVSTSRTGNHHSSLNSVIQESHATYPSSSNPTSVLQMKVNNKNISNSPKLYHDSPSLSDAENAGKKLAHIITQDIMNRAPVCTDTAEDQNNFVRSEFRKCSTENSLDCARLKQVNVDNHLDGAISQASTNGSSHHLDSSDSDSDSNSKDSEFKRKNRYNVSVRFGHKDAGHAVSSEDCIIDSDLSQRISVQSGIRHKLQNGTNSAKPHRLPEKQFEGVNGSFGNSKKKQTSRFADDTDIRNSDNVNPLVNGDVSFPNKSATISRIYNTSKGGRFEQTNIPHSNTDHNIRYSNSSFAPPPSPAPPHNLQEERTFIRNAVSSSIPSSTSDYFTSSHLAGGDTHSNYSSEFTEQHSSHWSSLTSAGRQTLPGYIPGSRESRYNFHRPRGIYTGKVDPATRNPGKVSNPCLRESSV